MGFMDLSTSVSSKKHVDFNDARYQLSDKLKQNWNKNIRPTFTLYDNKGCEKTDIDEMSAAYELSDKRLPVGELLNKMIDLIIDLEDGKIDSSKDAVYTWKYARALVVLFEDKQRRQETLQSFDNSLKNSVINSKTFIEKHPGKYTNRTNFFDKSIRDSLVVDIFNIFKDSIIPQLHQFAVNQSKEFADRHSNVEFDKIVKYAVDNYGVDVDSFFKIKEDEITGLYYSLNTVILHMKNGYDVSIIGYAGTDHDDKFEFLVIDACDISIKENGCKVNQATVKKTLDITYKNDPIVNLTQQIEVEAKKNEILKKQYDILVNIRPMVSEDVLEIKAAESVVGKDYIWGCKEFRKTHDDLPKDFKLEDIELPDLDILTQNEIDDSDINKSENGQASLSEFAVKQPNNDGVNEFNDERNVYISYANKKDDSKKTDDIEFDSKRTLLPGIIYVEQHQQDLDIPSVTKQASPEPDMNKTALWKDLTESKIDTSNNMDEIHNEECVNLVLQELSIDDIDSLFSE